MVNYICDRCGYTTTHRVKFKNHLFRKRVCFPINNEMTIHEVRKKYGFKDEAQSQHKVNTNTFSDKAQSQHKVNTNETQNKTQNDFLNYECDYCEKIFKSKQSKYR